MKISLTDEEVNGIITGFGKISEYCRSEIAPRLSDGEILEVEFVDNGPVTIAERNPYRFCVSSVGEAVISYHLYLSERLPLSLDACIANADMDTICSCGLPLLKNWQSVRHSMEVQMEERKRYHDLIMGFHV